jgi:molybdopterin-guanine dinucleotide biosynthesis protein A
MRKDVTGIILAGGRSSRFGSPKAFAEYDGHFFYEHAVSALLPHVQEVIIVSSAEDAPRFTAKERVKVISDTEQYKGKGPLAGIYSAMNHAESNWYFVLPCDMPLIGREAAEKIASFRDEAFDAVIPEAGGRIQPLAGLYHQRIMKQLKSQLDSGSYRMILLLNTIHTLYIDEEKHGIHLDDFQNINDQTAFRQIIERQQ